MGASEQYDYPETTEDGLKIASILLEIGAVRDRPSVQPRLC